MNSFMTETMSWLVAAVQVKNKILDAWQYQYLIPFAICMSIVITFQFPFVQEQTDNTHKFCVIFKVI